MKYVRTNEGIFTIEQYNHSPKMFECLWGETLKQADTIEELCDEFVVVNNTCFNMPQLLGTKIDKDYYKHEDIYGAIWTSKGLIYVAKMNKEGELELI